MTLAGGQPYPRELFVWLAFAVIIVTLVGQGTTLGWMSRVLKAPRDDPQADLRAEAEIQREASAAARAALDEAAGDAPDDVVQRLRRVNARRLDAAHDRVAGGTDTHSHAYVTLRRRMIEAEREVFRRARDEGRIAEEVLWRAQHDLDLEEALLERSAADEDED
jgi:CPA1 family monovalent cation:H+ antiporter